MNKENKPKSKKKTVLIVIIVIVILLIVGCSRLFNNIADDINELTNSNVAYPVTVQDMSETINASGAIASDAITSVTSELVGQKVTAVYVEVGDNVTKGQKIATVDVTELKSDLSDMKKAYNKEQKQLQDAYNDAVADTDTVDEAKEYLDAVRVLETVCTATPDAEECDEFDGKTVSKAEKAYNVAKKAYDAQVSAAKEALDSTSEYATKIKEMQKQINAATITAPCDGIVINLSVNKGSLITEGLVAMIQESEDYKVTVSISESKILKVKTGMKAAITVVATGDKVYTGTVTKVVKIAGTNEEGNVGYSAVITIDDKNTELLIGMTAKCKIYLNQANQALAVPYDMIHQDNEKKDYVYKLEKVDEATYKVVYAYVTIGTKGSFFTEIKDGLSEGDLVLNTDEDYDNGETIAIDDLIIASGDSNV